MKKLICSLLPSIVGIMVVSSSNAQTSIAFRKAESSATAGKYTTAPNQKAEKHFKRSFDVQLEKWREKPDGYRVTFKDQQVRYMVDYDKKGNWVRTFKNYKETQLAPAIAESVNSAFPGFVIIHVTEIELKNGSVHLIKIEDCHSLKTVRFLNGEMDVIEEYRKG